MNVEPTSAPWREVGRRVVYDSDWVALHHVDLVLPDGKLWKDIHLVHYPRPAVGVVPVGGDGRVLLIDHYRFATRTRGWEIPAGRIEADESPVDAAARELSEETGHVAENLTPLGTFHPSNGSSDQTFHVYVADGVHRVSEVRDTNETLGLRWFSRDEIAAQVRADEMRDGLTLTGLLWFLLERPA